MDANYWRTIRDSCIWEKWEVLDPVLDAVPDTVRDTVRDAVLDVGLDGGLDVVLVVVLEAALDAGLDACLDGGLDTVLDVTLEMVPDSAIDSIIDSCSAIDLWLRARLSFFRIVKSSEPTSLVQEESRAFLEITDAAEQLHGLVFSGAEPHRHPYTLLSISGPLVRSCHVVLVTLIWFLGDLGFSNVLADSTAGLGDLSMNWSKGSIIGKETQTTPRFVSSAVHIARSMKSSGAYMSCFLLEGKQSLQVKSVDFKCRVMERSLRAGIIMTLDN